MNNEYYVYEHATEDGDVYYIGKGKGNRAWSKEGRNDFWRKKALKHGMAVSIVEDGLTEQEAFDLEVSLISHYGRRDNGTGCLVNLTDGGEGASGASLRGEWNKILEKEGLAALCLSEERNRGKWHGKTNVNPESMGFTPKDVASTYEAGNAETMWEALMLSHVATPKEAEIADRARGTVCGLDSEHRVRPLKIARNPREPGKEWRKRIYDHIINAPVCAYG